ncbi:MAG TPA: hypothetical protein VKA34_18460 [Balneolales bacterium]|nr:hypothetical protein [Balneolales bacterium]
MTKILPYLLSIVLLVGCSSIPSNNSADTVSSSGILQKNSISTWQYGSFLLNDNNGKPMYALKSLKIDLSLYTSQKVKISGIKIKGYPVDGGPVFLNVTSIQRIN